MRQWAATDWKGELAPPSQDAAPNPDALKTALETRGLDALADMPVVPADNALPHTLEVRCFSSPADTDFCLIGVSVVARSVETSRNRTKIKKRAVDVVQTLMVPPSTYQAFLHRARAASPVGATLPSGAQASVAA